MNQNGQCRAKCWQDSVMKMKWVSNLNTQHQVERAFVILIDRGRERVNYAGFTVKKRQEMWCELAQTATMLDNIMVQEKGRKPPHTKFYGEDPKYAKCLRSFGEIGMTIISSSKVGRTKSDPIGQISMFVGYSRDHTADTYHFIN